MCKELYIWETAASHHVVPGDQIHLLDAEAIPTGWGRNPCKCRETTRSSLWKMTWQVCSSLTLSWSQFWEIPESADGVRGAICLSDSITSFVKLCFAWCHARYGLPKTSKQTNKKKYIHICKYSSWLHAFVSADSSRLACLVSVV